MPSTVSYDFVPNTEVFIITDDYTISEGRIIYVRALNYMVRTTHGEDIKYIVKYIVGLNDGRSIVTNNPLLIHTTFESAKSYLNDVL